MKVDPTSRAAHKNASRPSSEPRLSSGGRVGLPIDATVAIAQASIHVPATIAGSCSRIVRFLAAQDYVGGVVRERSFGHRRRASDERRR